MELARGCACVFLGMYVCVRARFLCGHVTYVIVTIIDMHVMDVCPSAVLSACLCIGVHACMYVRTYRISCAPCPR